MLRDKFAKEQIFLKDKFCEREKCAKGQIVLTDEFC